MRSFNVTGLCIPSEDYMVDISGKIVEIIKLIDERRYFTINRARQYGKTTTLYCLEQALKQDYIVISISFEGLGDESFASAETFCPVFIELIKKALRFSSAPAEFVNIWADESVISFIALSALITKLCESDKKIVLMIDEVDKVSNNCIFLHFLSMLREKFLARKAKKDYTFQSVILAGVYDIKNLKLKMINDGLYTPSPVEGKIYNSPWNIAIDFEIDMSFSADEIATMLTEYENDLSTGMDIKTISNEIYEYTRGYPYLVSRICQHIDEKLGKKWNPDGVREAVNLILSEKSVLFDDVFKNIGNNKNLSDMLYNILINGEKIIFSPDNNIIGLASMYGFIRKDGLYASIANRIFEIRICNYFVSIAALNYC